jgi:hypothetical protein
MEVIAQETLFKPPYAFFTPKCPDCLMRRSCVSATSFVKGPRDYALSLHHRKAVPETEAMLAGKAMHTRMESGLPEVGDAYNDVVKVLREGGLITLREVPIHSQILGLRGIIDRLTISRDGDSYSFLVEELKSSYWRPHFLQLGEYCYILFSHDAEILLRLPIEEKLKRVKNAGVAVHRGVLTLLREIKGRVDTVKLVDHIIEREGRLTTAAVRRVYAEGIIKDKPWPHPPALAVYPERITGPLDVSIRANLIISTDGKTTAFPLEYCAHNELGAGFGRPITRAIEKRVGSLRRWHKAMSLYELEDLPYCRECGPEGQRCSYPEYCLIHPPRRGTRQMHFSSRTAAVVKTAPPRVL